MGLTMDQQIGVAREMAKRYRRASKKKKGQLIEEYMELTGCTRHHAAWLPRCWGTTVWDQRASWWVPIETTSTQVRGLAASTAKEHGASASEFLSLMTNPAFESLQIAS